MIVLRVNPKLLKHLTFACSLSVYGTSDNNISFKELSSLLNFNYFTPHRVTCGNAAILAVEYLRRSGYRARALCSHGYDLSDPYDLCHQTVECYDPYVSSFVHFCPTTNVIFSDFNSKPLDYPHTLLSLRTNTVAFHRICPFVAANNLVNPYLRYSCTYSSLSQLHNWFSSTLCFPYSKISTLIDPPHYAFAHSWHSIRRRLFLFFIYPF